jgi:CRP-like cAMP-binding protein
VEERLESRQQGSHSLVNALRGVPSLEGLDEKALLSIVGDSANLFWPAESCVFKRGTETDSLYVVVSGSVRVLAEDGHEIVRLGTGNSFGEFSLLLGTPHQHDVYAVEDSELMVVPKVLFDQLIGSNTELVARLRKEAEDRLRENLALAAERA